MEYYYYCEKDWIEEIGRPSKVYLVDKTISEPHPEKIKDPNTKKTIKVKRYFDSAPAVVIHNPNAGGYRGKYGKFMRKRQDATAKRGNKTIPEMAQELGLCYEDKKMNPITRKEEKFTKYIKSDTVPTWEWEQLPASKRREAEKYGFLPMKELEAPAMGFDRVKKLEDESDVELKTNNKYPDMEVIYVGKLK